LECVGIAACLPVFLSCYAKRLLAANQLNILRQEVNYQNSFASSNN